APVVAGPAPLRAAALCRRLAADERTAGRAEGTAALHAGPGGPPGSHGAGAGRLGALAQAPGRSRPGPRRKRRTVRGSRPRPALLARSGRRRPAIPAMGRPGAPSQHGPGLGGARLAAGSILGQHLLRALRLLRTGLAAWSGSGAAAPHPDPGRDAARAAGHRLRHRPGADCPTDGPCIPVHLPWAGTGGALVAALAGTPAGAALARGG